MILTTKIVLFCLVKRYMGRLENGIIQVQNDCILEKITQKE